MRAPERATAGPHRRLATGLAVALAVACGGGGGGGPVPAPHAIAPDSGYAGLTTAVQITGDGFAARPTSGGQVDTHQRAWLGTTELTDVTWIDAHTLDATVPAGLSPGVLALVVENAYGQRGELAHAFTVLAIPARLTASITASRPTAGIGQSFGVTFTIVNGGTGAAALGAVAPTRAGPAASCTAPSPSTPLTLAAGATQQYTWTCSGSAEGTLSLSAGATGTDKTSGAALSVTAVTPAQVAIQRAAALSVAVSVGGSPATVEVGQAFTLDVAVTNTGGASANLASLTVTPEEAGCEAPSPALPLSVKGGLGAALSLSCAAAVAGTLAPAASLRGQDANTGALLTGLATLTPPLTVQAPTALTATISAAPTDLALSQATNVTFYVTNGAALPTVTVTSVAPWTTGGTAACTAVTVPPGTTIAAGASAVFAWTCTPSQAGQLLLGGTVNYTAGGAPGSASPAVQVAVTVTP